MTEANKDIVLRAWNEMIGGGRLDLAPEVFDAAVVYHGSDGSTVAGIDAVRELTQMYVSAFPGMAISVDDVMAEGDRVVTRVTARGVHSAPLGPLEATGRSVEISMTNVYRVAGGKIVEAWETFNELQLLRQLGLMPEA